MTLLEEIVLVSDVARDLERLSLDEIERVWIALQDEDDVTRRVFKAAVHAVRTKRLAMARPLNRVAV